MTVSGINLNYAVASNQKEQVYPALQEERPKTVRSL